MGYYNGSSWNTYMDSSVTFILEELHITIYRWFYQLTVTKKVTIGGFSIQTSTISSVSSPVSINIRVVVLQYEVVVQFIHLYFIQLQQITSLKDKLISLQISSDGTNFQTLSTRFKFESGGFRLNNGLRVFGRTNTMLQNYQQFQTLTI